MSASVLPLPDRNQAYQLGEGVGINKLNYIGLEIDMLQTGEERTCRDITDFVLRSIHCVQIKSLLKRNDKMSTL